MDHSTSNRPRFEPQVARSSSFMDWLLFPTKILENLVYGARGERVDGNFYIFEIVLNSKPPISETN